MAAATVDNKVQYYIWTGHKGSNLRSQLTLKLWHKAHKTHTHTRTNTHAHMNTNTNITQLKTFKERSKIYEFNSSFEWPQLAKVDSFWQCIPDVNYALAEKRLSNVVSAMFFERKRQYGNKRNVYINLHLKDRLDIEFTAC